MGIHSVHANDAWIRQPRLLEERDRATIRWRYRDARSDIPGLATQPLRWCLVATALGSESEVNTDMWHNPTSAKDRHARRARNRVQQVTEALEAKTAEAESHIVLDMNKEALRARI